MSRLAGKVALISGAARGQGAAEARLFAREGASVVLGDVRTEQGEQVAREIAEDGGKAVFTSLDVRSEVDWTRAVELAEHEFGRLDILVNNAAILGRPGIVETSLELWNDVLAANQTGPFLGMRAAIPALRRAGGARSSTSPRRSRSSGTASPCRTPPPRVPSLRLRGRLRSSWRRRASA
jgi:NAD(P)-dependent dehydrogenase (short-subunit alcohol dehydrogenase family)